MYQLYTMRRRSPLLNKHKHRNPTLKMHHIFKRFRNPCGFGHDFVLFALFFSLFAFFFQNILLGLWAHTIIYGHQSFAKYLPQ